MTIALYAIAVLAVGLGLFLLNCIYDEVIKP